MITPLTLRDLIDILEQMESQNGENSVVTIRTYVNEINEHSDKTFILVDCFYDASDKIVIEGVVSDEFEKNI